MWGCRGTCSATGTRAGTVQVERDWIEMLRKAIEAATENMRRLYDLSGGVEHDGEKGAFREFFVAGLIRPLLPSQYGVGSGTVVSVSGKQSRQTDVIIHDRRSLPPIILAGQRGMFPVDSVLAVVEVKSTLKANHYCRLADAARHFLPPSLDPDGLEIAIPGQLASGADAPQAIWPLFSVFAYTSDAPKKSEFERLEEQVPEHNNAIRLIGVLDKGVWCFENEAWTEGRGERPADNAVRFFCSLLNQLERTAKSRGDYRLQDWLTRTG